jgi:aminoglycoside phosphotransferase (APT) family kinase protein
MRREYRILAALAGSDVPHARAVALCDDAGVLGCTFYLMEKVEGVSAIAHEGALEPGPVRTSVRSTLARSLARLHDFGWREAGLGTLGRPDGFHERQVERWTSQLNSYGADRLPGILEVTSWLQKRIPASFEPALMHGDYHLMNVLLRFDNGPEVVAIIDWETTTIGDPLLDLAGFIETWTRGGRHTTGDEAAAIVSEYLLSRSKAHESFDLTYYKVLYNFRLAVLLEGVYQRSLEDPTVMPKEQAGQEALKNLSRAVELIRQDTHGTTVVDGHR